QNRKNLHEFFEENYYIHQELMNESDHEIYKVYKNSEEFYSEIFADINMMIAESIHHYHECKTFFISHNKLHDHICTECKLSIQSSSSSVLKNSKSTIILIKTISTSVRDFDQNKYSIMKFIQIMLNMSAK